MGSQSARLAVMKRPVDDLKLLRSLCSVQTLFRRDTAMRPNLKARTYPYTAWVLTRSFVVLEVELIGPTADGLNERSAKGKWYAPDTLFHSHAAAVSAGRMRIEAARAEIARRAAVLEEKSALLDRMSGR